MTQLINDDNQNLLDILEKDWQYILKNIPEMATFLGEHQYNDKLTDLSEQALSTRYKHSLDILEELKRIDLTILSEENKINYQLFYEKVDNEIKEFNFKTYLMPMNQMDGVQNSFIQTLQMMPFKKEIDFKNYLSRLKSVSSYIDQTINLMKLGIKDGYTVPKAAIINVIRQVTDQIPDDYKKSLYYNLIEKENKNLSVSLRQDIETAIKNNVYPAFLKLATFLDEEYLPSCRNSFGLSDLPNGKSYYDHKLKTMTTTNLTAEEIHQIGISEVSRIYQEMMALAKSVGFNGSYNDFLENLKNNPDLYFTNAKDLMMTYRDIAKRADKELPAFFKVLPRLPYGVEEIPAHQASSYPTAYYMPPDMTMTRAGIFYANTHQLNIRPKYEMEALTLHEAVPGHHLQIALSLELDNLPKFRRMATADYTGYIEGWGLYSEKLGAEMGFYTDPYAKFGQLSFEIWRACRLVVDTGLHAFNWDRGKAIAYMQENTGKSEGACAVEVDRYMSIPGQATAYKIGELKILELRKRFEERKDEDFDIREFHDVILRNGALPLSVLENYVDSYLAS
ncbi:MAG: DUF885 domain-containing protein [Candidatus Sericytochromatia bacterium]|nr:DUF885 domain-containing protein [Candidatus Sericytochromatia bacterium]